MKKIIVMIFLAIASLINTAGYAALPANELKPKQVVAVFTNEQKEKIVEVNKNNSSIHPGILKRTIPEAAPDNGVVIVMSGTTLLLLIIILIILL